jgi:hypothetical protein
MTVPVKYYRFASIYDRVVRRFWASAEPISEREFRDMVLAEGLIYPANRPIPELSPRERLRRGQ